MNNLDIEKLKYDLAMQAALAATASDVIKGRQVNPVVQVPNYFLHFYRQYDGEQKNIFEKVATELNLK